MTRDQRQALVDVDELVTDARRESQVCANGEWNEPVNKLGKAIDVLAGLVRDVLEDQ